MGGKISTLTSDRATQSKSKCLQLQTCRKRLQNTSENVAVVVILRVENALKRVWQPWYGGTLVWDTQLWVVSFLRLLWSHWSNSYVCHNSMSCKSCTFRLSSEQQKCLCCWRPWQQTPLPSKPLDYTSECGADPAQEGNMLGALPLVFAENSDF